MFEPFSFPFMQRAFTAGLMIGILGSFFGVFVVQRKMSFLGNGLAHSALGGVALGILIGVNPLFTTIPFTLVTAVAMVYIKNQTKLSYDTVIGIMLSFTVALGVIFLSINQNYSADAYSYLFGSILAVAPVDLWISGALLAVSTIIGYLYWSRWAYAAFDSELAQSDKINVLRDDFLLTLFIALVIVVSIKIVGILLISAFIVIPAAAARQISRSFLSMTIISIIIGVISSFVGLYISFIVDMPSGAMIIMLQILIFLILALFKRK
jgi:zinc transport system permease protein